MRFERSAERPHQMAWLWLAASCGLALFAWLTPNRYAPWLAFHAESAMAGAGVCAAVWILWRTRTDGSRWPMLAVLSAAAALIPFGQYASGLLFFFGDAWIVGLYLLGFTLAQVVGYRAVSAIGIQKSIEPLTWLLMAGALLSSWLALYQWQGLDYLWIFAIEISSGMRPYANLVQPNLLATMLILGIVSVAYLYHIGRFGSLCALLSTSLLGFALAMTQSRAGMVELLVVLGLLLWKRHVLLEGRLSVQATLIGGAILCLMPVLWEFIRQASPLATGRSAASFIEGGVRGLHWQSMIDAIGRQPWFGYGMNQTVVAQYAVAPDHPASHELLGHSHNLFLDLLVWTGVPIGLLLVVALVLWGLVAVRRAMEPSVVFALAAVGAMLTHAMVEYPLYYAYFLLPFGLLVGGISAQVMPRASLAVPRLLTPALLAIAALALVFTMREYWMLEEDVRTVRFEQARIANTQRALSEPDLLTQLGGLLRFIRTREQRNMSNAEIERMEQVMLRFPGKENIVRYAAALALNNRPLEATEALRRVCKTTGETGCREMQGLWAALGRRDSNIGHVRWPTDGTTDEVGSARRILGS